MSNPEINDEVEDVLSSIRRLVSSGERVDELEKKSQDKKSPAQAKPDTLMLTPALRIGEATDPETAKTRGQTGSNQDTPEAKAAARLRSDELKARVAELEEVVARQSDQWEPDGSGTNANSGGSVSSLPWQENAPSSNDAPNIESALTIHDQTADRRRSSDEVDFLARNEGLLDSDAMRDLVEDIVRQELQGALGDRITRNVRKLVRREINRALTSQEID